ncbi:MAG: S8 family serine peptidase [Actinomycetota bacterium]
MRIFRAILITSFLTVMASPAIASNDPGFGKQWGLSKIGAETAWQTAKGDGMIIAIIDSGIDLAHEDLKDKILPGKDYFDDDAVPQDEDGHGTHVAGIAAAITGNGRGVAGTAPGAKILPLRVLGPDGACSPCYTSAAIDEAVARGADVINLSLGGVGQEVFGPGFDEALERAWAAGVIPVVAAGNHYLLASGYEDNSAIVVSATNRNDKKPDFSSGVGAAKWGMAAPGGGSTFDARADDIYSTDWNGSTNNLYGYNAGTSMSAPYVAGAAAVLRSMGLTPQQTVDRLLATAVDIGAAGHDATFGSGRLDLAAAVRGTPSIPPPPPGTSTPAPSGKKTSPRPGVSVAPNQSPAVSPVPRVSVAPSVTSAVSPGPFLGGSDGPGPDRSGTSWVGPIVAVALGMLGVGIYLLKRRRDGLLKLGP